MLRQLSSMTSDGNHALLAYFVEMSAIVANDLVSRGGQRTPRRVRAKTRAISPKMKKLRRSVPATKMAEQKVRER